MTEEEYNSKYLGKGASYLKDKAKFDEDSINNPVYQEKALNNDEF